MIRVRIRYFGMIAEKMGGPDGYLEIPGDGKDCDIREVVALSHPVLAQTAWKVAVDQTVVHGRCDVHERSEIVLLPPYAGG